MEIKKQVILRSVAGEHMLIPVGETVFEYNGIFMMTESGKLLWENIEKGAEENDLKELLMQEYEIDSETALNDVKEFLEMLKAFGII
ncbi:MAG: PqqD family protein [Clostridia bacterium]|nr:PqqD family protein [Clostridia bacterium]MBQ6838936.1 PqqD family protein [Clostridia bacterium]